MKICVFRKEDRTSKKIQKRVESLLKKYNVEYTIKNKLKNINCDILLVIGDDRTILDTFLELKKEVPVLGIGTGGSHFLAEIEAENFEPYLKRILKNKYWIEKRMRLKAKVNGKELPPALNEVVVSSSKPGVFLRYSLKINDQLVWRDSGDGVIISTPTGSTSYAMSA
ncbi:MAG: NAD(+)/NADH kinase [Candidatus Aenigmarchaeota archaeon]|nr:NAD(+)/NADH kinase [Candidatus Aenigmarchaeota archaeon]